ncbi:MAG TPA: FUSC family protein [Methanobacterium sp.]
MEKKGFLDRFNRLSKPIGRPQWGHAVRAILLMLLAGLIAKFIGLDNGIQTVMFVTLLASIIIDISLPIRKVAILALLGFIMTTLAFISATLALSNLTVFILFTLIWAFFSISLYIFGSLEGSLGFTFFITYFVAVLLVNNQNTLDWVSYSTLSYLVVSILFIPKIWLEKKRIRERITVGFNPSSTIQNVMSNWNILSGIPINSNYFDIFKLGSYLNLLRSYSRLINSRLNSKSQILFKNYLEVSDYSALKIADHFKTNKGPVDLGKVDDLLSKVELNFKENKDNYVTVIEISNSIRNILYKCNELLSRNNVKGVKIIKSLDKPLKTVLKTNFNINNLYIRHAIRFTLAITIGLIFVYLTRERIAIWVTMGVLIILKPDITSTLDNLITRVGYNFFAIIIAIMISFVIPHDLLIWLAFIMLFLFRAFYPNYMSLSIIAITVFIVLIWPVGTIFDNAVARIVYISFGGVIAFICAYIILPSRVTVDLPAELLRTVKANVEYATSVLISSPNDLNSNLIKNCFKNYLMEENNLEAGVKKLEDTFKDINEDIKLYHELIASNNKLAADLTGIAAILNTNRFALEDMDFKIYNIKKELQKLKTSLNNDSKTFTASKDNFSISCTENILANDMNELICWILSDITILQRGIQIGKETDILKRYTKLT